jgi:response regulator RpfG family c-di-GMP phosphodiesterase
MAPQCEAITHKTARPIPLAVLAPINHRSGLNRAYRAKQALTVNLQPWEGSKIPITFAPQVTSAYLARKLTLNNARLAIYQKPEQLTACSVKMASTRRQAQQPAKLVQEAFSATVTA